jgi:hypothetical protein
VSCDTAIVGAGPYGLAASAELRAAGVDHRVFGDPMSFWRERMPAGMLIRSPWAASSFTARGGGMTLDDFERTLPEPLPRPLPLERFVEYGAWFQRRAVPEVDRRSVLRVSRNGAGFHLTLEGGERLHARRVVVAAGIGPFARRPGAFDGLPPALVSHSTDHRGFAARRGTRVLVVGGGQSALESAALLHESGAEVELLVRAPAVHWLNRSARLHRLGPVSKLLYARQDIGPAGVSRLVAEPDVLRMLPRTLQERAGRRAIRPAGSDWLVPRLREVPITAGDEVASARAGDGKVVLTLRSGVTRIVDHVVLGTGFRVDVRRYGFLDPRLVAELRCVGGYPVLGRGFESSVPALHFLGAPAARSFGPLMRFVAGAEYATPRLARHVATRPRAARAPAGAALEAA